MHGVEIAELEAGGRYLKVHHYADPSKDSAWLERVKEEMKDAPEQFQVEILMKEIAVDGKPVYPLFRDGYHNPPILKTKRLKIEAYSQFIMGWDCGTASIQPAAVLCELTAKTTHYGRMLRVLHEWTTDTGVSMEVFTTAVMVDVNAQYPGIPVKSITHAGDETGRNRQGATMVSAFEVMAQQGVYVMPVSNRWQQRKMAVDYFLAGNAAENAPMFIIQEGTCRTLVAGFQGAYRHKEVISSNNRMYGDPIKNEFSHPHDALQYAAVIAKQMLEGNQIHKHKR